MTDPTTRTPPPAAREAAGEGAGHGPETPEAGRATPEAGPGPLDAYLRANRGAYTEEALRKAALAAGNDPAEVEAALARTREAAGAPLADRGRVARNIFLWYLGVYLLLDVLMLINPANRDSGGFLGDVRGIGIVILSMALGLGLVGSLVWVGSRRLFWALVGVGLVLYGLPVLWNPYGGGPVIGFALVAGGGALIIAAAKVMTRPGVPANPTVTLLMSVPMLILLVVGGICVMSGLPVPRPG